jgi:O-antigen ligase
VLWSFIRLTRIAGRKKWPYLITFLLGVLCTIVSGSRAAMITLILGMVAYFLLNSNVSWKKKMSILGSGVLFLALGSYMIISFLPEQSIERMFNFSDSRTEIWKYAINAFLANPIIGSGMNAASTFSRQSMDIPSHNVYLDILCGSGLVGIGVFIVFLVNNCLRCQKKDKAFLYASALVFMLPLFFINGFNTSSFYLPLILLSVFSDLSVKGGNLSSCC